MLGERKEIVGKVLLIKIRVERYGFLLVSRISLSMTV